ncbi:hypothetical protein H311_01240, partial [Anncaliia algerae PRA109]
MQNLKRCSICLPILIYSSLLNKNFNILILFHYRKIAPILMWTKSKYTFILFMLLATRSTDIQSILYLPPREINRALSKYINKLYFEQSDENIYNRKDFINYLLLKFIKINN